MTTPQQRLASDPDAWWAWADGQLRPMDLNVSLMHSVLRTGQDDFEAASPLAPPTGPGTDRWQRRVVVFRERTLWSPDEGDGLPRTVHPSGRFCVIIKGGEDGVGQFGSHVPNPKHGLGNILQSVIDERPEQPSMFTPDLRPKPIPNDKAMEHWLFLATFFRGFIYSELSLPGERKGDRVTRYAR